MKIGYFAAAAGLSRRQHNANREQKYLYYSLVLQKLFLFFPLPSFFNWKLNFCCINN